MATTKLKLDGISKNYSSVTALDTTNLDLKEGEFLTLLGPSGSGKTTLLSIVAGLTAPSNGDIWIDGIRATHLQSCKRGIGMVFQNYALFPHLTIYENIAFPLRMRKMPGKEIDAKVRRVLDVVQLPHVEHRFPRELSGGQQQRIALARCLVYSPSIILMDEPLGALDKNLRDHMQLEIKRLHVELGITILYVTHDQEEALAMSNRICLMNRARIEQIGTPLELYFKPRSVFAAQFLGESNIISATVETTGEEVKLKCKNGLLLTASRDSRFGIGQSLVAMIRPESLQFVSSDSPLPNKRHGRVIHVVFTGSATKIHVRTDNGSVLVAKLSTTLQAVPCKDDEVLLAWRTEDTVLLSEECSISVVTEA